MDARESQAKMAAADVLGGLYRAIADHSRFEALLTAMDDFLDSNPEDLESRDADWKKIFRTHFAQVGQYVQTQPADGRENPIVYVDRQPVPAAVLNRRLDLIAKNIHFEAINETSGENIAHTLISPSDRSRLDRLFVANGDTPAILLALSWPHHERQILAVAERASLKDVAGQAGPYITLRVAQAVWNDRLSPLLENAYGLTPAEISVLEALVDTGSVSKVADARQRSIRTVRTQLTHIFSKLEISSQMELALFLATLTQMMGAEQNEKPAVTTGSNALSLAVRQNTITHGGRTISYLTYGAEGGHPVLMLQSSTPPTQTTKFRSMCQREGLYMIIPFKPGSDQSDRRPAKHGPSELASDYQAILDAEGVKLATIAGHCSGGLYALEFSALYPNRSDGVVLVDTGVPFRGRRDLMALPRSLRRTFLPARYIPEILLVPHRIFAANFTRSSAGEAQVVDYFFADSDVDSVLTRTDRDYYEITKRIIAYSFEDVDRLVADVCRWAQDWSQLLRRNSQQSIVFLHGDCNNLFQMDRIEALASQSDNMKVVAGEGQGQLQLYQSPENFAKAVRAASSHDVSAPDLG